jgi:hypothetical protein
MRFGYWRGVTLAIALISSMAVTRPASADGLSHTIPKEVPAMDLNTGAPYYAPPIPWGHYAKDGLFDHYGKKRCGICGLLSGKGAGFCGGHGLFSHGGNGGCGKAGCGLFHHGGEGCGEAGCGNGFGHGKRIKDCGLCKGKGCGLCNSSGAGDPIHALASSQSPAPAHVVVTSPQATPMASPQGCLEPGCKLGKGHHHGDSSWGDPCGSCGGKGCGLCGGLGRIFGHGKSACDSCGGKGCGKCGLFGRGNGCGFCGGRGCSKCGGLGGLHGKISGLLHPHRGDIKYFVGPGGPVPLTPGYVPWVNPVRSPRDFLAFPPYTPDGY